MLQTKSSATKKLQNSDRRYIVDDARLYCGINVFGPFKISVSCSDAPKADSITKRENLKGGHRRHSMAHYLQFCDDDE